MKRPSPSNAVRCPARLECCSLPGEAKLIDLLEGTIYSIPESMVENDGKGYRRFLHLPLRDYPLLLTFGDFAE